MRQSRRHYDPARVESAMKRLDYISTYDDISEFERAHQIRSSSQSSSCEYDERDSYYLLKDRNAAQYASDKMIVANYQNYIEQIQSRQPRIAPVHCESHLQPASMQKTLKQKLSSKDYYRLRLQKH